MPYSVFHIEGGIGKNIVATNVVRNIKKAYPNRDVIVVASYPEVFVHNPYISRVYKIGNCPYFYEDFIKGKDTLIFKHEPYNSNGVIKREENLSLAWCKSLNLELDEIKPELFFNTIEQQNSQLVLQRFDDKPIIALQINGGINVPLNTINFSWYRDLPPLYALNLVKDYGDKFNFVQIRHAGQLQLDNVQQIDLSIREVMVFLKHVKGAVCIDSFVQHCMACYNKSSVVCWVGNTPKVFGYDIHKNIKCNLKAGYKNPEAYLDPYPLVTQGYQCPTEYNPETLFDYDEIKLRFEELFLS